MAEEKNIDALINEAEELLNECRKNANDRVKKNYASMGYKNKQLADVINKNINEGKNLLSKLFDNVEGDDDTANGCIYYFINRNKKEDRYKITLDVEKGRGIISNEDREILRFLIEEIFTFNGQYAFTNEQIKEIDKKLKHSIAKMYDRVKLSLKYGAMHNSTQQNK